MRSVSPIFSLFIVLICALSVHAQNAHILISDVSNSRDDTALVAGLGHEFRFQIESFNECLLTYHFSNGFVIYSPDGAEWDWTHSARFSPELVGGGLPTAGVNYYHKVSGTGEFTQMQPPIPGTDSTALLFYSIESTFESGIGGCYSGPAWSFSISGLGEDDVGLHVCIDSTFVPPDGEWKWQALTFLEYPNWYGPYCYVVTDDCCIGTRGNVQLEGECDLSDQTVDISDLNNIIAPLFLFEPRDYCCFEEVDMSPDVPDGTIDIGDLTALIDHLFISFRELPPCSSPEPEGVFVSRTNCLGEKEDAASKGMECIEWNYSGETLELSHTFANMNCCPEADPVVHLFGGTIYIDLSVTGGMCDCNCEYNLEYRMTSLPVGTYHVQVIDATNDMFDPLSFDIDLTTQPSGTFCDPL